MAEIPDKQECDACGENVIFRVSVGSYMLCKKCSSGTCHQEAIEIAQIRHKEKLQGILKDKKK